MMSSQFGIFAGEFTALTAAAYTQYCAMRSGDRALMVASFGMIASAFAYCLGVEVGASCHATNSMLASFGH